MKELQIAQSLKGQFTSMKRNQYLSPQVIDQVSNRRTRQHRWRKSLDPDLYKQISRLTKRPKQIMRSDSREDAFVAYTNTSRGDPIEHRYKDAAAVCNLEELK